MSPANHLFLVAIAAFAFSAACAACAQSTASNNQNASSKATNSEGQPATGRVPNSPSNPGQAAPGGSSVRIGLMQRATPANPAAANQNWNLTPLDPEFQPGLPLPQRVFFEFLFNNIAALDEIADRDDKAGNHKSAEAWRTHDQRAAGLNDAEGEILQEVTLDCMRALKEVDAKISAVAEKSRAHLDPATPTPPPEELVQLVEERKAIVKDHIEKLRVALGDSSFRKLNTYAYAVLHAEPPDAPR